MGTEVWPTVVTAWGLGSRDITRRSKGLSEGSSLESETVEVAKVPDKEFTVAAGYGTSPDSFREELNWPLTASGSVWGLLFNLSLILKVV